jgi:GNAT superfamily N-acetyltransferase
VEQAIGLARRIMIGSYGPRSLDSLARELVMDKASALLRDIPDSPAGRQLGWYLAMLITGGVAASLEDRKRYTPEYAARSGLARTIERMRDAWRANSALLGEFIEIAVDTASEFKVSACIAAANGREWTLSLDVEEAPPHRIARLDWDRRHDFKLEVREATEAEAAILADIERRCPIVLGDTKVTYDRGEDYLAFARLMEDHAIGMALVDGVPAASSCGAKHQVRVGGVVRPIVTLSHLRVLPEYQRHGIWRPVHRALGRRWADVDATNVYIAADNADMRRSVTHSSRWSVPVLRMQLSCSALAGPPVGRPATPADAPAIIERLNTFHGSEEMFAPYSSESLTARLERAPRQYSWDKVWMTDGALAGVWPAGDSLRVVSETGGVRTESVRGVVLDYGCAPAAEGELESLLRAWCGWIGQRGMDTLSIFTSPASPGVELLRSLARDVETFDMWAPRIADPAGTDGRGLYVDPIYF